MQNKTKTIPPARSDTAIALTILGFIGLLSPLVLWPVISLETAVQLVIESLLLLGFARLISAAVRIVHELCWLAARVDAGLPFPTSDQPSPPPAPPSSAPTPDGLTKSP